MSDHRSAFSKVDSFETCVISHFFSHPSLVYEIIELTFLSTRSAGSRPTSMTNSSRLDAIAFSKSFSRLIDASPLFTHLFPLTPFDVWAMCRTGWIGGVP